MSMKWNCTFFLLILTPLSAAGLAPPTSTIQCYFDRNLQSSSSFACMSGYCVEHKPSACPSGELADRAELKYFDGHNNELLYSGIFPCSTPSTLALCQTYEGRARLVLEKSG